MVQWPPSPSVEDELTALSHEHTPNISLNNLKANDDPVVSRGLVDQYPIIVDSDDQQQSIKVTANKAAKCEGANAGGNSSDDSTGPRTPPTTDSRNLRRPSPPSRTKNVSFEDSAPPSKAAMQSNGQNDGRGRPQLAQLETKLGHDIASMATGQRRDPSPYSFSRTATTPQTSLPGKDDFLSTVHATPLPPKLGTVKQTPASLERVSNVETTKVEVPSQTVDQRRHRSRSRHHHDTSSMRHDHRHHDKDSSDASSSDRITSHRLPKIDVPPIQHESHIKQHANRDTMTPPHSRRQSRESQRAPGGEDRAASFSRDGNTRESRGVRERAFQSPHASPYTSSAEESQKPRHHHRRTSRHAGGDYSPTSPVASRKERPRMDDLVERLHLGREAISTGNAAAVSDRRPARRSQLESLPPLSADPAKSAVDFEDAFRRNTIRSAGLGPSFRSSGSALASPMTSPPRTPRSERQSRDYFEVDSTSQRPSQRSRPPSIDENQMMELKAHASLLSAATTGAAMAARVSGDFSNSAEHSSGNSTSKKPSTPRSRRPSPVLEEHRGLFRSGSYAPPEKVVPALSSSATLPEMRPVSRGSTHVPEYSAHPSVQRAFSYSGHEQMYHSVHSSAGATFDPRQSAPAPPAHSAVPTNRLRASGIVQEPSAKTSRALILPVCPRTQPTSGFRDWTSIKEISNIDICPTCMSVLGNTHFRDLFVPSLPRPYNEPSVCAMSKPWLRIAFLQAVRQNRPNLELMRMLSTLPNGTKPCTGEKPDLRVWFHIVDPSTGKSVPNFVACSACVRAIDTVFPLLEHVLERDKAQLNQERVCTLNAHSKHFPGLINQFEQATMRCQGRSWRAVDVQPLANYVRKVARFRECPRDRMLKTRAWHFIPELPEFTVCEECYEEVVWPLVERPIARDMSKTTRIVPIRKSSDEVSGISCQLYSDRMRRVFRDAVMSRNMALLRDTAKTRHGAQQRLTEMNKLFEQDQKYGINRRPEIERNNAIWRTLE